MIHTQILKGVIQLELPSGLLDLPRYWSQYSRQPISGLAAGQWYSARLFLDSGVAVFAVKTNG
jgi:hypothetical protein